MSSSISLPIEIQASLDALKHRLLAELPAQQQYIEREFIAWQAHHPVPAAPLALIRAVHSLSGRAGMYGMDELFRLSQTLEGALLTGGEASVLSAFSAWQTYLCEHFDALSKQD